ncbi:hypothetical protein FCM35_KLT06980 [Carex littledalei]|uniref:protein-serine/threonine phosphatase n=1 Tax=Carex littledalei TaxID=544730 RepID=A0A833QSE9_9POAL|nr:hypothetical protein FCM35_KLT06980 [Carex littledalei]
MIGYSSHTENVGPIRSEYEGISGEDSTLIALPVLPAINNEATCCEESELDNSSAVVKQKKISVFLTECKPLWGCSSVCGKRSLMEDAYVTVPRFFDIPIWMLTQESQIEGIDDMNNFKVSAHFFGVYDGHGGTQIANYCRDRIHLALTEELKKVEEANSSGKINFDFKKEWERAFSDCFKKVDEESELFAPENVGSTAVIAVVTSSHVIVANCGDSRAVLSRGKQAIPLSVDHKPEREEDNARIEAQEGKVVWWNGYRVFGVLAMSRCIGDKNLKPWITPVPETKIIPRAKDDDCLILASDGLWDVVSNQQACDLARKKIMMWHKKNDTASSEMLEHGNNPAAQSAAEYLSKLALQKGSNDNITVMVVDLKSKWKFKSNT